MKDEILSNLDNPAQLERLYREDKSAFRRTFKGLYPDLKDSKLADFWNARLNFGKEEISWGSNKEITFIIIAALVAGLVAKLPAMLHINEEFFYTRNVAFVVFPPLAAYFAWKNNLSVGKIVFIAGAVLVGIFFINYLPDNNKSDTLQLSCIHLLLVFWSLLGFVFIGDLQNSLKKRLSYLKYNGDLVVICTLILISGAIVTGVTIGLFSLIGLKIEKFYFDYVVVFGLPAVPILGTYLTQSNPQLVGKVSPVIAKIFGPVVLAMLLIYLIAIVYSGKNPYNNREFLLIFNGLLIGVMAIIFFSVAESSRKVKSLPESWVLFLLSVVTIIVNGVALSAILFRISEGGITPNRAAVLGSNVLILIHLVMVTVQLFKVISKKSDISGVGRVIAYYLPVYCLWAAIVTFVFPFLFGFK